MYPCNELKCIYDYLLNNVSVFYLCRKSEKGVPKRAILAPTAPAAPAALTTKSARLTALV